MTPALLFLAFAAGAFLAWMATGARWLIWVFVLATLVVAIDATQTGIPGTPILLPIASNAGG